MSGSGMPVPGGGCSRRLYDSLGGNGKFPIVDPRRLGSASLASGRNPVSHRRRPCLTAQERLESTRTESLFGLVKQISDIMKRNRAGRRSVNTQSMFVEGRVDRAFVSKFLALGLSKDLVAELIKPVCTSFRSLEDFTLHRGYDLFLEDLLLILTEKKDLLEGAMLVWGALNNASVTPENKVRKPKRDIVTCNILTLTENPSFKKVPAEEETDVLTPQERVRVNAKDNALKSNCGGGASPIAQPEETKSPKSVMEYDCLLKALLAAKLKAIPMRSSNGLKYYLSDDQVRKVLTQLDALIEMTLENSMMDIITHARFQNVLSRALMECGHVPLLSRHLLAMYGRGAAPDTPTYTFDVGLCLKDVPIEEFTFVLRVLFAHMLEVSKVPVVGSVQSLVRA